MIKFFRKIRQRLSAEREIRKYLFYAIGEIVLVVIGILIALQINNWNEERKDRLEEKNLLEQLQDEHRENLDQLNEKIAMRDRIITSSMALLSHIDGAHRLDRDSILLHLVYSGYIPTFDPIRNDLINSGKLGLIRDQRLRRILSSWTSEIVQVTEEEVRWRNFMETIRLPFLIKHNVSRDRIDQVWRQDFLAIALIDESNLEKIEIGPSRRTIDYEKFILEPEFESMLAVAISTNKLANIQSIILRRRLEEILDLIEENLEGR